MKKKLTLIFDFDGTIADSLKDLEGFVRLAFRELKSREITKEEIYCLRNQSLKDAFRKLDVPLIKLPFLLKKHGQTDRDYGRMKPILGMKKALASLRNTGIELGILTSNSKEKVDEFVRANDMDIFDFIYWGGHLFGKAQKIKRILKTRKLDPKNVIYIGDEVRDMTAAKKAGIKSGAVCWGLNTEEILKKQEPDFIFRKPQDLIVFNGEF